MAAKVFDDDDGYAAVVASKNAGIVVKQGKLPVDWSVDEVVNWLITIGFEDVAQVFGAHSVNGRALPFISDSTLKEMGIQSIGKRIQLRNEVVKMQAIQRADWRRGVVWVGEEYRVCCCCACLPYGFPCCFQMCTGKPALYKVTNSKINQLKSQKKFKYCPCFGHKMVSNNYDLSDVVDVNVIASTGCCGDPVGQVAISLSSGKTAKFKVKSSEAQQAANLLINAKEEAVVYEGIQMFASMR